jgi:hypothetical protein
MFVRLRLPGNRETPEQDSQPGQIVKIAAQTPLENANRCEWFLFRFTVSIIPAEVGR